MKKTIIIFAILNLFCNNVYAKYYKTTLVIIDENCSDSYIEWRKINTLNLTIKKIYVKNNILIHEMINNEKVYVLSPNKVFFWLKKYDINIQSEIPNKVLFFGKKSIELIQDEYFNDLVNEKLGKAKYVIPEEGCNKYIHDVIGC